MDRFLHLPTRLSTENFLLFSFGSNHFGRDSCHYSRSRGKNNSIALELRSSRQAKAKLKGSKERNPIPNSVRLFAQASVRSVLGSRTEATLQTIEVVMKQ